MSDAKRYIRFGELPKDGLSSVYSHGDFARKEKGVSVYHACLTDGVWHVVLPMDISKDTIDTYKNFRVYSKMKVFLVEGTEVGTGNDNEPLLADVKIIEDITDKVYKDSKL